jgi:protein O-GlcNAc transferase
MPPATTTRTCTRTPELRPATLALLDWITRKTAPPTTSVDPAALLDEGFRAHQGGDAIRARHCYERLLASDPRHADALYLLGTLDLAGGKTQTALERIEAAIAVQPNQAAFHYSRGEALRASGRLDEAVAAFRTALAIDDSDAKWWNELGLTLDALARTEEARDAYMAALERDAACVAAACNLANQHIRRGEPEAAAALLRQALEFEPAYLPAHGALSQCLLSMSDHAGAIAAAARAVALDPASTLARLQHALALAADGQLAAAEPEAHEAVALAPNAPEAHFTLGSILLRRGFFDEADAELARALELRPQYTEAILERADLHYRMARHHEAIAGLEALVAREPALAAAHIALANHLLQVGHGDAAEEHYRRAITLEPSQPLAHVLLSSLLYNAARFTEAEAEARATIDCAPDYAGGWVNLAMALQHQGRMEESAQVNRRALELAPGDVLARSNLLLTLNYLPQVSAAELLAEHRAFGARFDPDPATVPRFAERDRRPDRKLRIGYVSPDFRTHVVSFFFEPVLAHHDRKNFETVCYYNHTVVDDTTRRLRERADLWRDVAALSDADLVRLMREDQLDIVVDLAGHTAKSRLTALAQRVAPVQITWLGYPNTTGLAQMDWRITDARADPPGAEAHHTERLLRLPEVFLGYEPPPEAPEITPPPSLAGAALTFGVFNNFPKITDPMLALWARILEQTPGSRLLVKTASLRDEGVLRLARERMQRAGLDLDRVELAGFTPGRREHLEAIARVDVALDTFPYHGTTTTCESLWMGVPVVTLAGDRHAARVGVSLLQHLGLDELIANSPDLYVHIATSLANDPAKRAALRPDLRDRMRQASLTDIPGFVRQLEDAYRTAWREAGARG